MKSVILIGVLSAAMSTLSSSINSLASSTVIDIFRGKMSLRKSRIVSFFWAFILIMIAMLFDKSDTAIVIVGFRTPIDYGSNGIAIFNTPNDNENKASTELEKFSGIYWVTEVESTFAAGRFDQTLTMLRQRNQARQAKNVKKAAKDSESGTALTEAKYREMIDGPPGTVQTGLATRTSVASTGSPHRRVG